MYIAGQLFSFLEKKGLSNFRQHFRPESSLQMAVVLTPEDSFWQIDNSEKRASNIFYCVFNLFGIVGFINLFGV